MTRARGNRPPRDAAALTRRGVSFESLDYPLQSGSFPFIVVPNKCVPFFG
jgi:hypothetical protein